MNRLAKAKTQRRAHCLLVRMILHGLLRLTFSCPVNMDVLASRTKYDHTMRSVLRYFKDAPQVETLAMNLLANWFAATDEENRVLQNSNYDLCKATCKLVMQFVCNDKHTEVVRYALVTLSNMTSCTKNREQLVGLSLVNILVSRLENLHRNHNLLEEAVQVVEAISVSFASTSSGGDQYVVSPNAIVTLLDTVLKTRQDNPTLLTSLARSLLPLLCNPKYARDFLKSEGADVAIRMYSSAIIRARSARIFYSLNSLSSSPKSSVDILQLLLYSTHSLLLRNRLSIFSKQSYFFLWNTYTHTLKHRSREPYRGYVRL